MMQAPNPLPAQPDAPVCRGPEAFTLEARGERFLDAVEQIVTKNADHPLVSDQPDVKKILQQTAIDILELFDTGLPNENDGYALHPYTLDGISCGADRERDDLAGDLAESFFQRINT